MGRSSTRISCVCSSPAKDTTPAKLAPQPVLQPVNASGTLPALGLAPMGGGGLNSSQNPLPLPGQSLP